MYIKNCICQMDVNVSKISHTTAQQEDDNFDICLQLQNMNFTAKTGQQTTQLWAMQVQFL